MKARAKHRVAYNGVYHRAGETFEIDARDENELKEYCEIIYQQRQADSKPVPSEKAEAVSPKREVEKPAGRPRKKSTQR